jgi:hypothetical protein
VVGEHGERLGLGPRRLRRQPDWPSLQGSNYYNAGRANGLSFYESAAMAAFGSATWEFYGETNKPSLNDYINTTYQDAEGTEKQFRFPQFRAYLTWKIS